MRIFIMLISGLLLTGILAAQKSTGFELKGEVVGLPNGTIVKLVDPDNNATIAVDTVKKNKFLIKNALEEPKLFMLLVGDQPQQYVYLDKKSIKLTAKKDSAFSIQVKGSSTHGDYEVFKDTFNPLVGKLNSLATTINGMSTAGAQRDSLIADYYRTVESIQTSIDGFIDTRKESYVSPFVLFVTYSFYEDPVKLDDRFNRLSPDVQASKMGKDLRAYIDQRLVGSIGSKALDFSQPDTSGVEVSLSSLRGKYVLVDFWASWCGPCRMENPNVVANYQKFKEKNFTVLGVSLDRPGQKNAWLNAIYKDKLTWTHISDLKGWENAAAKMYNVTGIPFNFLVDPNGVIIAKNLRGPELGGKLCELLGCGESD